MCRLAAYQGAAIPLQQLLLEPSHSLEKQAWDAKELIYGHQNLDGYGFAWYTDHDTARHYRNTLTISADLNLPALAATLQQPLWLAMVRSATAGLDVGISNTQPYVHGQLAFMHNGLIDNFCHTLRGPLRKRLDDEIDADVKGNTDSEYLFALLRQILTRQPKLSIPEAITVLFAQLEPLLDEVEALLNFIISDGEQIYASRHAINGPCPSLYSCEDHPSFPAGNRLIVSEPLDDHLGWQAVPEHHLLTVSSGQPIAFTPLPHSVA